MAFKNDMTLMYAMHNALRRELERLARATSRPDDDPKHVLQTALGWQLFTSYLHIHHSAEDDMLWPTMRAALDADSAGSSDAALLDAMEAEHAQIDPLLRQIDAALAGGYQDPRIIGELIDSLDTAVCRHLDHEEAEGLPLIDATVTEQQFLTFGLENGKRIGEDMWRYVPWLIDAVEPQTAAAALGAFPPPLQQAYRDGGWQASYDKLTLWPR
jgi:hemerythrin-like domain-containing protein